MYDFCIVGAGITGITAASILARELGRKVIVIEKRDHIGGNCYDCYNEHDILVHKYGPHIFHTQSKEVWDYLSQFTEWRPYVHKVLAHIDDKLVSFPINLNTMEQLFSRSFTEEEMKEWIENKRARIDYPINAEEMVISRMGQHLYEKFFKNYTRKQWGIDPKELGSEVTARIPIRFNRDDRYFTDPYQGMPKDGYTKMFERMLDNKNIELTLNIDYKNMIDDINFDKLIYTGPIDCFFDYQFGTLPYRAIKFEFKTLNQEFFQPAGVVNYPNDSEFTRITEFKYLSAQKNQKTTVCYEYPYDCQSKKDIPCYPLLTEEARDQYAKYKKVVEQINSVIFTGRLAEYRYLNMDECVKIAMGIIPY
jgi:UDP-galactopyranose mutase